jgi:hypothetical protein
MREEVRVGVGRWLVYLKVVHVIYHSGKGGDGMRFLGMRGRVVDGRGGEIWSGAMIYFKEVVQVISPSSKGFGDGESNPTPLIPAHVYKYHQYHQKIDI